MSQSIQQSSGHSIRRICQVLHVPRSSHYHAAEATPSEIRDAEYIGIIKVIFRDHKRRYGYRRIVRELSKIGHACAPSSNLVKDELPPDKINKIWLGDITTDLAT
jgi:hypothetical protein